MDSINNKFSKYRSDRALTHPKYRADLDGLRGIAVLLVIGFHAFPSQIRGGFIGVDIFFVISGYLISTIIFSNLEGNTFSFRDFYSRRIRRIFPSLLCVLVACCLLGGLILWPNEYQQLGKHVAGGAGFISNFLLWQEAGYFDASAQTKPLLHLWSLGIEEQFYIIFPALIWSARKIRFNLFALLAMLFLISFGMNVAHIYSKPIATFYSPVSRFWELIGGSLLAFFDLYKKGILAKTKWGFLADVKSILGFVFIILALVMLTKDSLFPGGWALLPIIGAVLIISAGPQSFLNRIVLSNKILVWVGLISYPLYLWHYVLLVFSHIIEVIPGPEVILGHKLNYVVAVIRIVVVIMSVLAAWITYKVVEKPIRFGSSNRIKDTTLLLLMLAVGAVGLIIYKTDGFPFRRNSPVDIINQHQLTWHQPSTEDCVALVGLNPEIKAGALIFCTMSGNKDNLKIAIIGDSMASALMPGFEDNYKDKNIGIINIGNGTCAPFRGINGVFSYNNQCNDVNHKIYDFVLKNSSIKTVILGFASNDMNNMNIGKLNAGAVLEDKIPFYAQLVQKDISDLKKAGKNIVVTFDTPMMNLNRPQNCLNQWEGFNNRCHKLESELSLRQPYIRYWENLLRGKNVCIFYQSQGLKSEGVFNEVDNRGVLLYRDGRHLSYNGSDKVAKSFMASTCSEYIK
ncbi:MAG: acyltransferase [Candidatus Omnitrophica bacterium]|nr:acyltransferase [Candidatus Omnitrophota bacterium]